MRFVCVLPLMLVLAACGDTADLRPAPGQSLPVKPAMASRTPTPEELLAGFPGLDAIESDRCRAELVFFETPSGGAVFSTGSIGWASALSHQKYDNNVSRLSRNVLLRFLDPTPFG